MESAQLTLLFNERVGLPTSSSLQDDHEVPRLINFICFVWQRLTLKRSISVGKQITFTLQPDFYMGSLFPDNTTAPFSGGRSALERLPLAMANC